MSLLVTNQTYTCGTYRGDTFTTNLGTEKRGSSMHAIFLTFDYAGDPRSLASFIKRYTGSIAAEYGVLSSTWLNDGSTAGAFYMFLDSESADCFLRSSSMRALSAHPEVSDFYVRHFSILKSMDSMLQAAPVTVQSPTLAPFNTTPVWQAGADQVVDQRN